MKLSLYYLLLAALLSTVPACDWRGQNPVSTNRQSDGKPADLATTPTISRCDELVTSTLGAPNVAVRTVAVGLDTPWALAFAPDGRLFVTERPGRLRVIENGQLRADPVMTLPVAETSESGLLGLAIDPRFPGEPFLYVMYTLRSAQGARNRVSRLLLSGRSATEDKILVDNLPAANIHDGGRLKFGPDGLLYLTLGDTASATLAQDPSSPAGKIMRLSRDGTVPAGNPFSGSATYTLGHRNPQGLAWQPETGLLYATEHGPSGNDEVNLIEAGQNYGWPAAQGGNHPAPFRSPLAVYSPAVAPSGAAFYESNAIPRWCGSLFFTALVGRHLHRLVLDAADPTRVAIDERLFEGQFGRLRDVAQGPDGALYLATSNRDGRGNPSPEDDRILQVVGN